MLQKVIEHRVLMVVAKFSGRLYCFLMNQLSVTSVRYFFKKNSYWVEEDGYRIHFLKSRGIRYRHGFRSIGKKVFSSYNIDESLIQPEDYVLDVGANNGDFFLGLPTCKYIGFEPSPKEFALLEKNIPTNKEVFNFALGERSSTTNFYVSSKGADSSLIEPPKFDEIIKLNQVSLDKIIHFPVKLLKIDAEGAELQVLKGAAKVFDNIKYIAIDLGFEKGITQETTAPEVINYLLGQGFEILSCSARFRFLFENKLFKL